MNNQSAIFWFSGTGNSLYAAKRLSADLANISLIRITDSEPSGAVGGKGEKIGFVFPSYYGNMPRAVRSFVEKLEIRPDTFVFAIVTMGGLGQGSIGSIRKALKEKGLRLNYGRGIHMPANYVVYYNPADPDKSAKALDKADRQLSSIAADIAAGSQTVKAFPVTADNLYKDIENLDLQYTASDDCTGCGTCERTCPVGNIRLEDGKPMWLNHCERCVACISWCPAKAINYGNITQTRRRYRNPRIKADELKRS